MAHSFLNETRRNVTWEWIGSECASSYIVTVRMNQTNTNETRTTDNSYHLPFLIEAYEITNIRVHVSAINMFDTVNVESITCSSSVLVTVAGELARLACFVLIL